MVAYVDYAGTNLQFVDAPDASLNDPTGNFELIVCLELDNWNLTNWVPLMSKHDGTNPIVYLWQLRQTAGNHYMQLEVHNDSNTRFVQQSTLDAPIAAATAPRWFRVVYVHDTGAGNYSINWYYSDNSAETAVGSVSWTATGAQDTGANATINTSTITTKLIGTTFSGNQALAAGKLYCASIRYGGSEVADPDFRTAGQTSDGGLTFVDSYANTWTVGGDNTWFAGTFDIIKLQVE